MKKVLLSLAAAVAAFSANAQVLDFGFETEFANGDVTNWEQYPESQFNWQAEGGRTGNYSLGVSTVGTANRWERVVAFKGLQMESNKSYRVSLWVKGTGALNVALMQGDWNADMPLLAGNGETYVQQVYDATINDAAAYKRVSFVFWHPTEEIQNQFYAKFHTDNEKAAGEFLRLSFTGEGQYNVDDVLIEESTVQSIVCNGDAIRVTFGYATNAANLAEAAGGTLVLDKSAVTVKVDGEVATVESVEIKNDGNLYIFLDSENYALTEENVVSVSFTNPGDLVYTTTTAPECWENPNCAVYSFTDEAGLFDEDFQAESVAYEEAELVSSTPADNSFEWDYDINTFSFTFNKPVWANAPENGKPTAVLSNGQDLDENLEVVEFEGCQTTLTFKRPAGAAALSKGTYSISVDNVANEKDVATTTPIVITFEVGKVQVSKTTYTLLADGQVGSEIAPLGGWQINNEGEMRYADASYGSGPRLFEFTNSTVAKAIYFRTGFAGGEGAGYVTYGDSADFEMTLPAGEIEFRAIVAAWKNSGYALKVEILDPNGNAVAESSFSVTANAGGNRDAIEFQKVPIRFNCPGGKFTYKVSIEDQAGQHEALCGGYEVYSYEETEGEKTEKEVLVDGTFADVNDNCIPAAGSGWRIHRGDAIRTPGANGGWGGNCVTGGGGPRVFALSYKGLAGKGVYLDGGTNNILTYGEFLTYNADGEEVEEKTLTLPASKVQITFYSALWKAEGVKYFFEIIPQEEGFSGTPIFTKSEVIESASPSGDKTLASVEAMKTQFFYTAPAEGKYLLRFYTNGEGFIGNISVETVASLAVQYKQLLEEALDPAKEELETAMANDLYAGETRDALDAAIKKCTNPDFHTAQEYIDAIAELEQLVKAMATRRVNINNYASKLEALQASVDGTTEKYQALEAYKQAVDLLAEFAEVAPETLDDEKLAKAIGDIDFIAQYLKNMAGACTNFLIAQITELATAIVELDSETAEGEIIVAANNALTDDQELVTSMKYLYAGKLYKQIADGHDFFNTFDEEYQTNYPDSLNVSFLLQNRGFYTNAQKQTTGALANENSFPGWDINIVKNSILADWGWGGPYNCTEVRPISDAAVCTAWGTSEIYVSQKAALLPAGIYTASIKVGDGTSTSEENLSYAFVNTEATNDTIIVENDGGSRNAQPKQFTGIVADVDAETATASLTIGAALCSRGDFSKCDDAVLYMTAKAEGFDYATAADKLLQLAADGIQLQTRDDAPAQVSFFNLKGQRINAAEGVCIKIERYADGYTVVKKVVVK
ncbi:MAG: hypothetical protein IJP70_00795 [Bacteroidales bacterium]|nr:hypothetical protein [Bacteroidales bacterium]